MVLQFFPGEVFQYFANFKNVEFSHNRNSSEMKSSVETIKP